MRRLLIGLVLLASTSFAASNALLDGRIARVEEHPTQHKIWKASVMLMAVGQFLDATSSIGGRELNPVIGNGSNGTFNVRRGFALKGAIVGSLWVAQSLDHRINGDEHEKMWIWTNTAVGGFGFAAAAHNWEVK